MAPSDMRRVVVDLDDGRRVWIKLRPSEVAPEQEQHVAVEYRVIARRTADHAAHADIVRIVVLDEVLAAGRVRRRRLQARSRGDHLVVRAIAARAGIDRDLLAFALIENGRDLFEIRVARADERLPRVDGI